MNKYRIWDSNNKEYTKNVFLDQSGNLYYLHINDELSELIDNYFEEISSGSHKIVDFNDWYAILHCKIEWQLIGNFYQGDIVKIDNYIGEISIKDNRICIGDYKETYSLLDLKKIELLGNINENYNIIEEFNKSLNNNKK